MMGIWVPWRAGNPAQQARLRRAKGRKLKGIMSHREAMAHARKKHRQAAFKDLRRGRMSAHEYQARYGRSR